MDGREKPGSPSSEGREAERQCGAWFGSAWWERRYVQTHTYGTQPLGLALIILRENRHQGEGEGSSWRRPATPRQMTSPGKPWTLMEDTSQELSVGRCDLV